ncbi:MAG TPA: hypothetical protein VFB72_05950 [Verrucomicrobiae bacterium]|nr:hypothetical protein [Verrucomicrobiae bacterium]
MTAEKVERYVHSIDFAKLSPTERARVLRELAEKLNALSREERQRARLDNAWRPWFAAMTDGEKEEFIDLTVPGDVKQMLTAFEQMPADKRKKIVDSAMKNLQNAREQDNSTNANSASTNGPVQLSPELVQKAETLGLKTFYTEGSPETKAELAPLIEEMQATMQSGRAVR